MNYGAVYKLKIELNRWRMQHTQCNGPTHRSKDKKTCSVFTQATQTGQWRRWNVLLDD